MWGVRCAHGGSLRCAHGGGQVCSVSDVLMEETRVVLMGWGECAHGQGLRCAHRGG